MLYLKGFIKRGELSSFVIFKGDTPVGFALFTDSFVVDDTFIPLKKEAKLLKLVAIDPVAQGKGLAKHLVFSVLKLFPKTKRIKLSTEISKDIVIGKPKNQKACQMYLRYGFKPYIENKINYDPSKKQFFVWDNPH
ncbi:GNAT family N-acetyltransferase [Candidatus Dependentiae bacterium]